VPKDVKGELTAQPKFEAGPFKITLEESKFKVD
jgi:hypothetical protein